MNGQRLDLVSVIVPVYRTEAYLDACVASIVSQTYSHLDIILVDDGSDDGAPALCDLWAEADPRIRVIHQANRGLSAARNSGLDRARGTFVTFVDSDDLVAADMVETLHALAVTHTADVISCELAAFVDEAPRFVVGGEAFSGPALRVFLRLIRGGRNWEACAKIFRMAVFDTGLRFREGLLYEDLELVPKVYDGAHRAAHTRSRLYGYRRRSDSIMGESSRSLSPDLITVLQDNIDLARQRHLPGSVERDALCAAYVLHASSKLEQFSGHDALQNNSRFLAAYGPFVRRNLRLIATCPDISVPYRFALALSAFSPRGFLRAIQAARWAKSSFAPALSRRVSSPTQ